MKLKLRFYKQTGKWYQDKEMEVHSNLAHEACDYVASREKDWDGFIAVSEIQKDGFEQPIRLIDLS